MECDQPPHHGKTFGRGHSVHRDVKRPPLVPARDQGLVKDLRLDPVVNPARSDKDDIDVVLLLSESMHLERNPAHLLRKELADTRANENKNENSD